MFFFHAFKICWILRKLFEHEAANVTCNAIKQTCVFVILAYFKVPHSLHRAMNPFFA